jgi:hypothetical protein
MRIVTSKMMPIVLLLALTVPSIVAQKNLPAKKTSNVSLIRNISGAVDVQGCGCYFQFPSEDRRSGRYLFFEDFSEESPLMNIDGENVRLKLISSTEPSEGVKRGGRFSRSYVSSNIKVRIDFVATSVCAPNDEACESTNYDVTVTVIKGSRRQSVKAIGGCGC